MSDIVLIIEDPALCCCALQHTSLRWLAAYVVAVSVGTDSFKHSRHSFFDDPPVSYWSPTQSFPAPGSHADRREGNSHTG